MSSSDSGNTLRIKCSNCSKVIRAPKSLSGKIGKCPACGNQIQIPHAKSSSTSATPEETPPPDLAATPDAPESQSAGDSTFPGVQVASKERKDPQKISSGIQVLESRAVPAVWLLRATMLVMAIRGYFYWCVFEGKRGSNIETAVEATFYAFWILFLTTGIFYLRWKYRANANLQSAGKRRLKYSPFGCCGYYFLPILNFVFPMRAMHEIQSRSKANVGYMVYTWWTLMMLTTLVDRAMFRNTSNIYGRDWIVLIALIGMRIVAGFFLIRIIKTVTEKQRRYRLSIEA